ncbi:hypothetical protein DNTS_027543 [Danionella cerebrum]|uniref:Disks large-associated protein 5 n=1 Tax=Danionella cerebrum TaxID=2873325 RepID=A0A553RQL5_9TELE|nr:hypothetical protein DNTS_027543 [Danionella translucida]
MESRFSHLYKRDCSTEMMRLKMSRRRSQSQKENREKIVNMRRHLDQLPETELSMDATFCSLNPAAKTKSAVDAAAEERKMMLARYKEKKTLQKELDKRAREKKGVFKTGLYKPQPLWYLPTNTAPPGRGKTTEIKPSTRITRSMAQNSKPADERHAVEKKVESTSTIKALQKNTAKPQPSTRTNLARVELSVRAPVTRSTSKTGTAPIIKPVSESKATKAIRCPTAPSSGRGQFTKGTTTTKCEKAPAGKKNPAVDSHEDDDPKTPPASFAPQGFVFQPPVGLKCLDLVPLSQDSTTAFIPPSFPNEARVDFVFPSPTKSVLPAASLSPSTPPPDHSLQPLTCVPTEPLLTSSEPQHDVSYFRAEMVSETERLTGLSELWESRFDDSSVPEEMRDRMRTAVGQARLLMKERFGQFSGLVDDCDFKRGEKITTCTDLQGFWDMVYFQAAAGGGTSAAAKSRLAAVKAAMRAKQAEQKSTDCPKNLQGDSSSPSVALGSVLPVQTVVFHGGFFQVESPVKPSCPVRRSCRISTVPSPSASKFSTPGRQRRSIAFSTASPRPLPAVTTPLPCAELLPDTPRVSQTSRDLIQNISSSLDTQPCSTCVGPENGDIHQSEQAADPSIPHLPESVQEHKQENMASEENDVLDALSQCSFDEVKPHTIKPSTQTKYLPAASDNEVEVHNEVEMSACSGSPHSVGVEVTGNQDDVEGSDGLDIERYLLPSARASLSPEHGLSVERISLGTIDAEMESPVCQPEELPPDDMATATTPSRVVFSSRISQMPVNMLLFTPERERVRQSVCERDLMTFTPPSNK